MKELIWLIPLVPLVGFAINGLLYLVSHRTKGEAHGDGHGHGDAVHAAPAAAAHDAQGGGHGGHIDIPFKALHTAVGVGSVGIACLLAFGAIFDVGLKALSAGASHAETLYRWIPLGVNQSIGQIPGPAREWFVDVAFRLDSLSALMLAFVTFVGFLIHVYSIGYMAHDPGYARYMSYLNLFMFAMLTLVLGANFPILFVGWEGVGLCSYLLIGFWLREGERGRRRQEGLHRQPHRRRRLHARHLPRASCSSARSTSRRDPDGGRATPVGVRAAGRSPSSACSSSSAPAARARRSRSTSGCRTRWRARRRSRP